MKILEIIVAVSMGLYLAYGILLWVTVTFFNKPSKRWRDAQAKAAELMTPELMQWVQQANSEQLLGAVEAINSGWPPQLPASPVGDRHQSDILRVAFVCHFIEECRMWARIKQNQERREQFLNQPPFNAP
jgi:hypothetical protein